MDKLGTITLDPLTIHKGLNIKNAITTFIWPLVGFVAGPSGYLIGIIGGYVNTGHTEFYIKLTQYVSTDYQWHYYTYTIYEDAACRKSLGTVTSAKWKDRYTKRQIQNILKIEGLY